MFEGYEPTKYIALAWLTGILPIIKEKATLLSNFHQFTMLDSGSLGQFMGFTENEVRKLCSGYHQDYNELKKWYGRYFLNGYELFNPMAVCRHMKFRRFNSYWSDTASYEVISDLFSMNITGVETTAKGLLSGACIEKDIRIFENDLHKIKTCDDVLTYLIFLGYLGFDENKRTVYIPNEDVRKSWEAAVQ